MGNVQAPYRFFSGSSTPAGFRDGLSPLYDAQNGWRVYLLLGGAGSGKSTFLKKVFDTQSDEAQVFLCSADPRSLDGVCLPSKRLLVMDATAPHAPQPQLWGACEQIVPLSLCADERRLFERRKNVLALTAECREWHARCRRCLSGAVNLLAENARLQQEATDEEALRAFAARLAAQEWEKGTDIGREQRRFLTAVTPDGIVALFETVQALCPRIYVLCDEQGAVAGRLLHHIKTQALADGQTVVVCPCPLFPDSRIAHVLLPESGTAFITANRFHTVDFPVYRRIHATRFVDNERLREHKSQLAFRQKAADELMSGAIDALGQARKVHTALEKVTAEATDWQLVDRMTDAFLERMRI